MHSDDVLLQPADIQALSNPHGIATVFLRLGYAIDPKPMRPELLGITDTALAYRITAIQQIAIQDDWLRVYLIQVTSLRVSDRQALARALRVLRGFTYTEADRLDQFDRLFSAYGADEVRREDLHLIRFEYVWS